MISEILLNEFGGMALFRESSDLSWAPWQKRKCHLHDKEELGRWWVAESEQQAGVNWIGRPDLSIVISSEGLYTKELEMEEFTITICHIA